MKCKVERFTWHLRILLLAVCFTYGEESNQPTFVENGTEVKVPLGRDAVFNCTVRNAQNYQVTWIAQGRGGVILTNHEDKVSEDPRVFIRHSTSSSGVDSFLLILKEITYADEGPFRCQINTKGGLRRIYTLSVVVPPLIEDTSSSEDISRLEGEDATLKCKAGGTPPPAITWRREKNKLIAVGGGKEVGVVKGDTLHLSNLNRTDAGAYLCIANNGVPPSVSKRILVDVRYAPEISRNGSTQGAYLGEDVTMTCLVNAWPRPKMQWVKDGSRHSPKIVMSPGGNFRKEKYLISFLNRENQNEFTMSLTIRNLSLQDVHSYRCIANNSEGSAEASILIIELQTTTTTTTTTTSTTTSSTTASTTSSVAPEPTLSSEYRELHKEGKNASFDSSGAFYPSTIRSSIPPHKSQQNERHSRPQNQGRDTSVGGSHSYISNGTKKDFASFASISICFFSFYLII